MQGSSPCVPFSPVSILEQKMKSSTKGVSTTKQTTLNPNAKEFIPLSLRSPSSSTKNSDVSKSEPAESCGKAVLDRTDSATSNTSDDETQKYWRYRLPDDITPDFVEDLVQDSESFSSGRSSGFDYSSASKSLSVMEGGHLAYENMPHGIDASCANGKSRFVFSDHGEGRSASGMSASSAWDQLLIGHDQQLVKNRDGYFTADECDLGFLNELLGEQALSDNNGMNPVEYLVTQFPDFAAESLAGIYYASGGDLNLTMEMLTQLELQEDAGSNHSFNTKSSSAPNLTSMDFPALSSADMLNGLSQYTEDDVQQAVNTYKRGEGDKLFLTGFNTSGNSIAAADFAAVVRKNASENSGQWKYDRNGAMDVKLGSGRNSQVSRASFAANSRVINGDRLRSSTNVRQTPQMWLETGEAVANMYSDLREEARDHARVRNAYFEQARQAYLTGNKALARELSAQGQIHNGRMKAAHGKAGEAIYRQRNQASAHLLQAQERMIDLHGLHVNEAIHVLKGELAALRNTARSCGQRQQVLICVGTGHHTKGSRTPARLPIAIERYLLEDEHLDYTEPQPGMLRVVIY
uniref:TSA: Wollemia nobilis Ref_Wollemi_Transcript_5802_2324 transcribed RNA sequence n=1 Tax=Wollemia nobilis TaxID=56998 RepID=A0A0C9S854_9CONI